VRQEVAESGEKSAKA